MRGKVVLVTGATDGIGKQTALALARQGVTVVITGRNRIKGEGVVAEIKGASANPNIHLLVADLSVMREVRELAAEFKTKFDRLDVLVNNAGGLFDTRQVTKEGLEYTFAFNHLAYFVLTLELLDLLKQSAPSRIVNVSSSASVGLPNAPTRMNWEDLQYLTGRYPSFTAYSQSKLANVLFSNALARRLEGTQVTVNSLHPGTVASRFGDNAQGLWMRLGIAAIKRIGAVSPAKGAETSVYLASSPEVEGVTGKYFDKKRAVAPNPIALDQTAQERLWDISQKLLLAVNP
jgi:NAD(P)-dependent dehydrogenase (short-subunit alcohol dehydrogenase family)